MADSLIYKTFANMPREPRPVKIVLGDKTAKTWFLHSSTQVGLRQSDADSFLRL